MCEEFALLVESDGVVGRRLEGLNHVFSRMGMPPVPLCESPTP